MNDPSTEGFTAFSAARWRYYRGGWNTYMFPEMAEEEEKEA